MTVIEPADPLMCDFCCREEAAWRYPAADFSRDSSVPGLLHLRSTSTGDWAACGYCHRLIEADDWETLAAHCVMKMRVPVPMRPMVKARLKDVWTDFQRARTGTVARL